MGHHGNTFDITMSIFASLRKNADNFPSQVSITERNYLRGNLVNSPAYTKSITHSELLLLSASIGKVFSCLPTQSTHIALLMDNCCELLPTFFGILLSGSIAVMLDTHSPILELIKQIHQADVSYLIYGMQNVALAAAISKALPCLTIFYVIPGFLQSQHLQNIIGLDLLSLAAKQHANANNLRDISDTAPAVIYFSSGSTGHKKAILLDYGSLCFSAFVEQNAHKQTPEDTFLCIPPFYHAGAMIHTLGGLTVGAKTVILRGIHPKMILETIASEKCTIAWMPVPCAIDILEQVEKGTLDISKFDLSSLRLVHMGAQPIPDSLIYHWQLLFPTVAYETTYGLTEAGGPNVLHSGVGYTVPLCATEKPGFGWTCKIVDEQGNSLPLGSSGELLIHGRGIMCGYYHDPVATASVLSADGWLHTGDIACTKNDGSFQIIDRKKNVIIRGGENIYPAQVEALIREIPGIADVAVIGIPDHRLGEVPACAVRLKSNFAYTEAGLLLLLRSLPKSWRPKRCFFCDIPHLSTGKIDKISLLNEFKNLL